MGFVATMNRESLSLSNWQHRGENTWLESGNRERASLLILVLNNIELISDIVYILVKLNRHLEWISIKFWCWYKLEARISSINVCVVW